MSEQEWRAEYEPGKPAAQYASLLRPTMFRQSLLRYAQQKTRAVAGAPISGLPKIGHYKMRKPGKSGLRAQFDVSHFATLRRFRKSARIIDTAKSALGRRRNLQIV